MRFDAYVNVRMPSGVYAAVAAEARRHKVTLSHVIREAVAKAVSADKPAGKEIN